MTFGEFFKVKREERGLSIRQFCAKHDYDSGNISKLERGVLPPPQSPKKLEEYAKALGVKRNSSDFDRMQELANIASMTSQFQSIFHVSDERVLERLPELFNKLNKTRLTEEKINKLIEAAGT